VGQKGWISMMTFGFDFVFLAEHADYRAIGTNGRIPLVFNGLDAR